MGDYERFETDETGFEIIERAIPPKNFWRIDTELADVTGYSKKFWKELIDEGRVKVLQRAPHQPGSPLVIPRSEIVRVLTEMVR
jgi:hypothetical protein